MIGEGLGSNLLGITSIWSRHKYTDATDRYSGSCNVVFMDGHVEAVQLTKRITGEDGSNNYFDRFWGVTKYQGRANFFL
jgi:prepilin-type processing-associated H-X9-DG protein